MAEQLDPERRRQLEDERDFLLQSLDDLELEHESGGIDDESYAELHDDYTARAAAVIRTLRDGVDVRPRARPAPERTRRRVAARRRRWSCSRSWPACRSRTPLGARLPGQTASGNSAAAPTTTNAASKALKQRIERSRSR